MDKIRRYTKTSGLIIALCLLCWTCHYAPIFTPNNFNAVRFNIVHLTHRFDAGGTVQFTGVIIARNRILTVAHGVTGGAGQIKGIIYYRKGIKEIPMTVIKVDKKKDLALLRFNPPFDRKPIVLAKELRWGEPIIFGGFNSINTPRLRFAFATWNSKGIMAHPVWFGDSGSPMLNTKNELVGIIYRMDIAIVRSKVVSAFVYTMIGYGTSLKEIGEFLDEKM